MHLCLLHIDSTIVIRTIRVGGAEECLISVGGGGELSVSVIMIGEETMRSDHKLWLQCDSDMNTMGSFDSTKLQSTLKIFSKHSVEYCYKQWTYCISY